MLANNDDGALVRENSKFLNIDFKSLGDLLDYFKALCSGNEHCREDLCTNVCKC